MRRDHFLFRYLCLHLALSMCWGLIGCRNPAQSNLPPSAISPPGTPIAVLAKGDVYADETELDTGTTIRAGDMLDIVIRRGAGEEQHTARVHKTGWISMSLAEIEVEGLTANHAAARIQAAVQPYMRNPHVQVHIKRDKLRVKRVFVFGSVETPGMYPMTRHMTVMEAILAADNYTETALLDEIKVVRGNFTRPEVVTADLARLFSYGDLTRNLALQENDVIYVPRERLGDASESAKKLIPIIQVFLAPFQAAFFGKALIDP